MKYLLDTNIFIQAKNLHYGMDFCPAFWDWLIQQNAKQKIFSIEKVADELMDGKDKLTVWAAKRGHSFFLPPNDRVLDALGQISQWVISQQYEPSAISTFFQIADYYLVAHALSDKYVVVTHEVPSDSARRIKIPNVCIGMQIKCITPYQMLQTEKARFVLSDKEELDI